VARKSAKSPEAKDAPAAKTTTKPKARTRTAAAPKRRAAAAAEPGGAEAVGAPASGRSLVIVESPKKARAINKFLGSAYVVKASMGHVRDLPKRTLGLDVEKGYVASYEVMPAKKETVGDLKREAARADMVYLATDPDREGEAIAWHLQKALGLADARVRRVLFHEITEKAVKEAFRHVGPIDMDKVNAQQARRFLDRFVGYQLSPLLWKKVARNLSAGRVQSVAVRLIADREREIRAFVSEEYWEIDATLAPAGSPAEADRFAAGLAQWQGQKFAAKTEAEARSIRDALAAEAFAVSKVQQAERADKPDAPFKTSTLQQQAAIRLRFSGKKTMKIAQELYEGIDVGGDGPGRA
jgi:DNA topoisomerase-1